MPPRRPPMYYPVQQGYPPAYNPNIAYQRRMALGDTPMGVRQASIAMDNQGPGSDSNGIEMEPQWRDYEKIPNIYVVSVILGGVAGNTVSGSKQLRPEAFVLKRITWATTGDTPPFADTEPGYSVQGRAVTMLWSDEFTKLMGNDQCLISSIFGDSNGFLDIPRGALFQGKQNLTVNLTRLHWPSGATPANTQFDFVFQGLGLLPRGVAQSGSAG